MLAVTLYSLFEIYDRLQKDTPSLFPTEEEIAMAKAFDETAVAAVPAMDLKNMDVIQGGLESF